MKQSNKLSFFLVLHREMAKRKKVFILATVFVFLMASIAHSQAVVERYRLGNSYMEGIAFISEGKLAGKFAFADGWNVYAFDIQNGTYEKLFCEGNLNLKGPAHGICFISKGNFAGNFLLVEHPSTLFIVSPSGTLISEVTAADLEGDYYQTEGITEITSGPSQGKFAVIVFEQPGYIPHILIFRIEDIGGTLNAYFEKDIGPTNLGTYPLGICYLPDDYPDPAYRNHFVISDLEVESDSGGLYMRVIDEDGSLKAKFPIDSGSEGLAYINKGQYTGKLMLYDMGSLLACMRNLDGTEKVFYDFGVGIGLSPHLISLAWLENTNQFLIGRWMIDNYFYFVSRLGPDNWRKEDEKAYYGIPRLRDITELTPEGYFLLGIKWDGYWKRWVQKLDSDFNFQEEYQIWEHSDSSFLVICYIHGDATRGTDEFALAAPNDKKIYLFDETFSSYETIDLSGKVDNITDICYDAAIQEYYLLDSGNLIHVFDADWDEIDQCDVSNLHPRGFSDMVKITSGDLESNFALLNGPDLEIVIINFEYQKAVSQLENLIEEIQTINFLQGLLIQTSSVGDELKTSLIQKLENAINSIENGKINAAINQIEAFQNEVLAHRGEKIPADVADDWINRTEEIIQFLID